MISESPPTQAPFRFFLFSFLCPGSPFRVPSPIRPISFHSRLMSSKCCHRPYSFRAGVRRGRGSRDGPHRFSPRAQIPVRVISLERSPQARGKSRERVREWLLRERIRRDANQLRSRTKLTLPTILGAKRYFATPLDPIPPVPLINVLLVKCGSLWMPNVPEPWPRQPLPEWQNQNFALPAGIPRP